MVAEGEGANPMAPVLTDTSNSSSREVANHDSEKPLFGDEASERQADSPGVVSPCDPSQVPDGGLRAWMVVSGAFCCVFCSFGWLNCIGIFQDYYQSHQLRNYSPSAVSWIASLELFIMFAGGSVIGPLYDRYGPRHLLFGTVFHVFGLMMTSLCKKYYQIMLAQGIVSSASIACLFTPSTNCVISWFHRKRAFAIGIVAAGSSLGGVLFPIMIHHLVKQVGFGWAIRIAAFLILAMLCFGNLTVQARLPPPNNPKPLKLAHYIKPLAERTYLLTTMGSCLFYLGMFLPINYIQVQANANGMSASLAEYLVPILNGASLFGRIIPGWIGDRMGRYNTQIAMSLYSGTIVLALWLPARGNTPLIIFAVLYGFSSGAFVSLLPAMIAQISEDMTKIGPRVGLQYATISVAALVSNPIKGGLIHPDRGGGFRDLQIYCGVLILAGSVMFICARVSLAGLRMRAKA